MWVAAAAGRQLGMVEGRRGRRDLAPAEALREGALRPADAAAGEREPARRGPRPSQGAAGQCRSAESGRCAAESVAYGAQKKAGRGLLTPPGDGADAAPRRSARTGSASANWMLRIWFWAAVPVMRPAFGRRVAGNADRVVGLAEVHVVEEVHDLDPELQVARLRDVEALEERGVHVPEPGAGEGVALHVAEGPPGRTAERAARLADGGGVEPLRPGLRPVGVADEVGTVRAHVAVGARAARTRRRRAGRSGCRCSC